MSTIPSRESFLRGVASVFDLFPSPRPARPLSIEPELTAKQQALADQLFDPQYAAWNARPDTANEEVAQLLAHAELLASYPQAAVARPDLVDWLGECVDYYEREPARFGRVSKVGNLWVDQVKLAADRRRVRLRMLARVRELIAVARGHCPSPVGVS